VQFSRFVVFFFSIYLGFFFRILYASPTAKLSINTRFQLFRLIGGLPPGSWVNFTLWKAFINTTGPRHRFFRLLRHGLSIGQLAEGCVLRFNLDPSLRGRRDAISFVSLDHVCAFLWTGSCCPVGTSRGVEILHGLSEFLFS
jgi:hypothetical protein